MKMNLVILFCLCVRGAGKIAIRGAGASLPASLYREVAYTYLVSKSIEVTYEEVGSGNGIELIMEPETEYDFAGSDATLTNADYAEVPDLQMYPSTATAVVPIYHLGSEIDLVLSREALAAIYSGEVTMWDDALIAETNRVPLPSAPIAVVARSDASGTTEIFTKALSSFSDKFNRTVGVSKLPKWDSINVTLAYGTDGVVAAVLALDYSIGYVVLSDAIDRGSDYASMVNKANQVVEASPRTIEYAMAELSGLLLDNPRLTADIQDASSSTAWPISGLTYFVLRTEYVAKDCETKSALVDFIRWYYSSNAAAQVQERLGFSRLPEQMRAGVVDIMVGQVLCGPGGPPAAGDFVQIEQVPLSVPQLARSLFATFNAAYLEVEDEVSIESSPYPPYMVDERLESTEFDAKVFVSDSVEDYGERYIVSPFFLAGVAVRYRLDAFSSSTNELVVLSPATLALIFSGIVTKWNDPAIAADNRDTALYLPDQSIDVVARSDYSETTMAFTRGMYEARPDLIERPAHTLTVAGAYDVAESDSQTDATILYRDGSVGYIASFGDCVDDVVETAATLARDGVTRLKLDNTSLTDCLLADGVVTNPSTYVTTLNLGIIDEHNDACWPFAMGFDVAVPVSHARSQCHDNSSAALNYVKWLYDTSTLHVDLPMQAIGVTPVSTQLRKDFFREISADTWCPGGGHGHSHSSGTGLVILLVLGGFTLLLCCAAGYTVWQGFHIQRQKKHILTLESTIEMFNHNAVAMRSVSRDWMPTEQDRRAVQLHLPAPRLFKDAPAVAVVNEGCIEKSTIAAGRLVAPRLESSTSSAPLPAAERDGGRSNVKWYWEEDADRMDQHEQDETLEPRWVQYTDSTALELENAFVQFKSLSTRDRFVDVTVALNTTVPSNIKYRIDLLDMTQTNVVTDRKRNLLRRVADIRCMSDPVSAASTAMPASSSQRNVGLDTDLEAGDAEFGLNAGDISSIDDDEEYIEDFGDNVSSCASTDNIVANEPMLVLKKGALVQITKNRADGWSFGSVVLDPDDDSIDSQTAEGANKFAAASRYSSDSLDNLNIHEAIRDDDDKGAVIAREDADFALIDARQVLASDSLRSKRTRTQSIASDDNNANRLVLSYITGWFPLSLTSIPDRSALARLAKQTGSNVSVLEVPETWEEVRDPLVAQFFRLEDGDEKRCVVDAFMDSLDQKRVQVQYVERIQNVSMWQSYAVKRQTVLQREVASNHLASRFERIWLFHGTNRDFVGKIVQQGFNRSFCGKNATMYGKGVYFAKDSKYSASEKYSRPNEAGEQFMLLVRCVVGEYCLGRKDALTPDIRDEETLQLYDSTVNSLQDPSIFVTYHDAQAYPEYLVCFKSKSAR